MNCTTSEKQPQCIVIGCPSFLLDYNEIQLYEISQNCLSELKQFVSIRSMESENAYICLLHFCPEDICAQGLRANAMPSLNLEPCKLLSDVVHRWVLENQTKQHISQKCCYDIAREVRLTLGIKKPITNPEWIRYFTYQPIMADAKGMICTSKKYTESGVLDIIKELTRKKLHLLKALLIETAQADDNCNFLQKEDTKDDIMDTLKIKAEESKDCGPSALFDELKHEKTWSDEECDKKDFPLSATTATKLSPVDISIESYKAALEYLKPLQIYAAEEEEHFPVIGLLKQLHEVLQTSM